MMKKLGSPNNRPSMSKITCETPLKADMPRVIGLKMLEAVAEARPRPALGLLIRRLMVRPTFDSANYHKMKINL